VRLVGSTTPGGDIPFIAFGPMSGFRLMENVICWRIPVDRVAIAKLRLSRPADPRRGFIALFLKKISKTPGQS
jgi:uncharacterized membrane protein